LEFETFLVTLLWRICWGCPQHFLKWLADYIFWITISTCFTDMWGYTIYTHTRRLWLTCGYLWCYLHTSPNALA
jgi:hypothetical protein